MHPIRLGNDIVDFSIPETQNKYQDARFMERVFNPLEITAILKTKNKDKDKVLWAIWSAKESAFKACQKNQPDLNFSPKKFLVSEQTLQQLLDVDDWKSLFGTISHNQKTLSIHWSTPAKYCIHCCAVLSALTPNANHWESINYRAKRVFSNKSPATYQQQSTQVRALLISLLSHELDATDTLSIVRQPCVINGILRKSAPVLYQGKTALNNYEISLSHDHNWVAAAYGENFTT